jgi:hypothetical protein
MLKSRFMFAAAMAACACALHAGRTIEADYTLEADEDWSSEGTVTINAGVVVNLNGHDLRVGGLAGEGRIVSSTANLVANGSFEVFNAAISGTSGGFAADGLAPDSWTYALGANASSGWAKSNDKTWSSGVSAHDGGFSVFWWCKDAAGRDAALVQTVTVEATGLYRLSFWTSCRPGNAVFKNMRLHAEVDGRPLGHATCGDVAWRKTVFDVALTAGTHEIAFRSDGTGGASNPCALFDDVSLRRRSSLRLVQSAGGAYDRCGISVDENVRVVAESQTLSADCDWSALGPVTLAGGAVIDLAGHDLSMDATGWRGEELVKNGSFETFAGTPSGGRSGFTEAVYPKAWESQGAADNNASVFWVTGGNWCANAPDGAFHIGYWVNKNSDSSSLVSQQVTVPEAGKYRLSFWTAARSGGYNNTLTVGAVVDGETVLAAPCPNTTWRENAIDLDLAAGIHTVAFRGAGRSATTPGGGVDKVSLRPANAAITNSDGGTTGELRANVAAGWMANDSVVIGGNVKLVKEGAGTFASHMVQAYTGGTLVAGGTAQPPDGNGANDTYSPAKGYTAFGLGKIVVGEGAFFDLRGNYDFNGALSIDLDGGTITSGIEMKQPGWGGSGVGMLTKDSFVNVQQAIVFGGGTLDLGGHKLSASMAYGKVLYAKYSVISNGTLETSGTGWLRFDASCDMRTVRFVSGSPLALGGDITIELGDYVVSYAGNESDGTGVLNVHGAFVPNTDSFFGCTMQDGSTIDLSGRTTALPAESSFAGSQGVKPSHLGVSFAANARVTVNLAGREGLKELAGSKDEGGAFAGYLMMWGDEAPDASVKFVLDAETAERYYLSSTGKGLLLRRPEGLGVFIR